MTQAMMTIAETQVPQINMSNTQYVNAPLVQTIVINSFGREDTAHIGPSQIKALLDDVLKTTTDPRQGACQALQRAAIMLYSDPEYPANLTCYTPNKKEGGVRVKNESGVWELRPYAAVNPPLVTKTTSLLFANQPFDNADRYTNIMKALRDDEKIYVKGKEMQEVFVRNKEILRAVYGGLPP
jgi:hypothetical protein